MRLLFSPPAAAVLLLTSFVSADAPLRSTLSAVVGARKQEELAIERVCVEISARVYKLRFSMPLDEN